jgi:hypothetical protein
VPEQLCRFVPSEWPEAACRHEALLMWVDACTAWLAEATNRQPHPGAWTELQQMHWLSGDSNRSLPFGESGDAIDVIRAWGEYRHLMTPCAAEARRWDGDNNGEVQYGGSCDS